MTNFILRQRLLKYCVLVFILKVVNIYGQNSPCPSVFQFQNDGVEYYGIINVPSGSSETSTTTLTVKLGLDYATQQRNSPIISLLTSNEDLTRVVLNRENLRYKIKFPPAINGLPDVIFVKLNGKEYCSAPGSKKKSKVTSSHSFSVSYSDFPVTPEVSNSNTDDLGIDFPTAVFPPYVPPTAATSTPVQVPSRFENATGWLQSFKFNNVCGIKREEVSVVQTILNGFPVNPGEYPWLAALFNSNAKHFCGGSLISDQHVITAAHCTRPFQFVWVYLGRHNLKNNKEDGVVLRISQQIYEHPEYREQTAHGDISIIKLSEKVSFTEKIKPICLWPFTRHNVGLNGVVAGWGQDQSGDSVDEPLQAEVDIVADAVCRASHTKYKEITTEATFCAGGRNKGPCVGDSGGGMIVQQNGKWFLKGIISISLRLGAISCDVNKYAVYCDVGRNLEWIRTVLT